MSTISAVMIVKDEAHVIERSLETLASFVDFYSVVDTGSSDDTVEIILRWLKRNNRKGIVGRAPWEAFDINRTQALRFAEAQSKCRYGIAFDADDIMIMEERPWRIKKSLQDPIYNIRLTDPERNTFYHRPMICRLDGKSFYRSVVHEYLTSEAHKGPHPVLDGILVESRREGARNTDQKLKFERDAQVLLDAINTNRDPDLLSRYFYYIGQTYFDANDYKQALKWLSKRAEQGESIDEVYISLLKIGYILSEGEFDGSEIAAEKILPLYDRAIALIPRRAEAYMGKAKMLRKREKYFEAVNVVQEGLKNIVLYDCMYVESWIYSYGLWDELLVNAYSAGDLNLAAKAIIKLKEVEEYRHEDFERINHNIIELERLLQRLGIRLCDDSR